MNYRFRIGDKGELVIQVEEDSTTYSPETGRKIPPTWRDATIADVPAGNPFAENKTGFVGSNFWISAG